MNAKIIPMSELYRDRLVAYMHRIFPTYTDAFIQYEVDEAVCNNELGEKAIIAVNQSDQIVGCHFFFITKAWIHGEESTACWGYNTYLDKEYRRIVGLDLIVEMTAVKNGFGYGLTDINYKIQHLVKGNIFINGLRKYCKITKWFILRKIESYLSNTIQLPLSFPSSINFGTEEFHLCQDVNEITIPNGGFWYKTICEVDFIRDYDFLNKRYFHNPVNKYHIYTNHEGNCYFVIRPIHHRGIIGLQVSDVRYLPTRPEQVQSIFHAIEKICSKMHAGTLSFTTSDKIIKAMYDNKILCNSYPVAFVCGKKNVSSADAYIIVNAADSDDEYYK